MKILVGSKNPGKVEGAKRAFEKYFDNVEAIGVKVPSDVSDEPVDEEIAEGAKNRVLHLVEFAKNNNLDVDYFVAVESGMTNKLGFWQITNVAVVKDKNGLIGIGTSAGFPVPERLVEDVKTRTLGTVMDELFDETNLHSGTGGVGLLTHGEITRIDLNTRAFVMALTQFVNDKLWCE